MTNLLAAIGFFGSILIIAPIIIHMGDTARCCWFGRHNWQLLEAVDGAYMVARCRCQRCGDIAKRTLSKEDGKRQLVINTLHPKPFKYIDTGHDVR